MVIATTELSLSITPQKDGKWLVVCGGVVARYEIIRPPLSTAELDDLRLRIKQVAQWVKVDDARFRSHSVMRDDWTAHLELKGQELFNALIQGKLKAAYSDAALKARGGGLRVRVCSDHPDVVNYPWELLCDPDSNGFLSRRNGCTLVRSGERVHQEALTPIAMPLRVLIVAASPRALYQPLEWSNEERLIRECVHVEGECEVKTISGPNTRHQLEAEMRGAMSPHVIHFIGHGDIDPATGDGALVFQGDGNAPKLFRARDLADLIGGHTNLRLVVLNSCRGTASEIGADDGGGLQHFQTRYPRCYRHAERGSRRYGEGICRPALHRYRSGGASGRNPRLGA